MANPEQPTLVKKIPGKTIDVIVYEMAAKLLVADDPDLPNIVSWLQHLQATNDHQEATIFTPFGTNRWLRDTALLRHITFL